MGSTALTLLFGLLFFAILVLSIVFLNLGYKNRNKEGKRNIVLIVLGWVFLGLISIAATILIIHIIQYYSSIILVFLLFTSPLAILIGLILSLSFGITNLTFGYREKDKSRITRGYVAIGIFVTIILAIVILIVWFSNYLHNHPISFM